MLFSPASDYWFFGGPSKMNSREEPPIGYLLYWPKPCDEVEANWNVMAHAQKLDFVFRRNGRVRLNRQGRQFSRLLAAELCASAVVMLDTSCSEVVWRVLATHSIHQFPLHFPSRASPCAITFQLESTPLMGPQSLPQLHLQSQKRGS